MMRNCPVCGRPLITADGLTFCGNDMCSWQPTPAELRGEIDTDAIRRRMPPGMWVRMHREDALMLLAEIDALRGKRSEVNEYMQHRYDLLTDESRLTEDYARGEMTEDAYRAAHDDIVRRLAALTEQYSERKEGE